MEVGNEQAAVIAQMRDAGGHGTVDSEHAVEVEWAGFLKVARGSQCCGCAGDPTSLA